MKTSFLLCLVLMGLSMNSLAKDATFPEEEPMLSLTVPDDWESEWEEGRLYIVSDEDDNVVVEVSALEATKKEGEKAIEEMKKSVEEGFQNVKFDPMQQGGANNVGLFLFNATGEDDQGQANLNVMVVSNGDNDQLFMVFIAASDTGLKRYSEEISAMIQSLKKL